MKHPTLDFDKLQQTLGHDFRDIELMRQALTHSSAKRKRENKAAPTSTKSYERLEFLGDRVLGLKVASMLYEAFPGEPEGHLAKRHALLVSKPTLARVARKLGLQDYIMVSLTERSNGGLENDGLLSDVVEALIAAMFLDQDGRGKGAADAFIAAHWSPMLKESRKPPRDPKTALQEWTQSKLKILPTYRLVSHSGPSHKPVFEVEVLVDGYGKAVATGANKREAERGAAKKLISALEADGQAKGLAQ